MRYLGSKASTLPVLTQLVGAAPRPDATFCDPFGGVAVVGSHFRGLGWRVHSGDVLWCAHQFQVARLALVAPPFPSSVVSATGAPDVAAFVAYLNDLRPVRSWLHREFAVKRRFFTPANAMAIDAVRRELARLLRLEALDDLSRAYYGACLIESADRVANTAGTYYAHLKDWTRKALHEYKFELLPIPHGPVGAATIDDAAELSARENWDVLYLDPPYNSRDYAGYYHLPETFATGRRPRPTGRSGVQSARGGRSAFTQPRSACHAMENLLDGARCKKLVVHYSDDGLIPQEWLRRRLRRLGRVSETMVRATGYSTNGGRSVNHRIFSVTK